MPRKRIDAATAQRIEDKRGSWSISPPAPELGGAAPHGVIIGQPNYREMTFVVAEATGNQLPQLHLDLARLGSIQSIEFGAVGHPTRFKGSGFDSPRH